RKAAKAEPEANAARNKDPGHSERGETEEGKKCHDPPRAMRSDDDRSGLSYGDLARTGRVKRRSPPPPLHNPGPHTYADQHKRREEEKYPQRAAAQPRQDDSIARVVRVVIDVNHRA